MRFTLISSMMLFLIPAFSGCCDYPAPPEAELAPPLEEWRTLSIDEHGAVQIESSQGLPVRYETRGHGGRISEVSVSREGRIAIVVDHGALAIFEPGATMPSAHFSDLGAIVAQWSNDGRRLAVLSTDELASDLSVSADESTPLRLLLMDDSGAVHAETVLDALQPAWRLGAYDLSWSTDDRKRAWFRTPC